MSGLGNLSFNVTANIGGVTSNMELIERRATSAMGSAAASVDGFRASMQSAANDAQRVSQSISSNMEAANDAIISSSEKSAAAIQQIADTADKANFQPMSDRIAEAVGKGIGAGIVAAEKGWDTFVEFSKTKALVVGLAVSAAFAAVGLGAIYTAYRVISGSMGFIVGLLTGDSYKSENIDALIEANKQVLEIQSSLNLTAQAAASVNAALASMGVDKTAYINTFTAAAGAVRENTDELDRLGVAYKDAQGNLLPLSEVIRNANSVLDTYTEGWDRNKAATAIGLGSAADVAAAASVTAAKIAEARERLNDYNLGIGEESQAAVKAYEDAMRAFNRETELTSQGFKRAVADNVMPLLTDLAEFFKDGFPSAVNAFRYSIATITTLFYGLKEGIYIVAESILGTIDATATGVTGLAVAAARAFSGDFSGAKDAMLKGWSDARDRMALIGSNIVAQHQHNAAAVRQAWAMDDRAANPTKERSGRNWVPRPEEATQEAAGRAAVDPFERDMTNLDRTQASIKYVTENFDKFQGKVKESKAAMAEFDVTLGKYSDAARKAEDFSPLTEEQKALYIKKNQLIDEGMEKERQLQVLRQFDKSADQFIFKEQQALDYRRQDIDWMGKSQVEIAKLTEARRIDGEVQALIYKTQLDLGKQGLTITEAQIQGIKDRADAANVASARLIDMQDAKAKDPWFNATESVRKYGEEAANVGQQIGTAMTNAARGMEDAFVRFATTGKLSFSSLATAVIADIARMQARALVSGIFGYISNIANSFFGNSSGDPAVGAGDIQGGVTQFAAEGGLIRGPGSSTSDSIPARLSDGEFVVNAAATSKNRDLLEAINGGGKLPVKRFATGGYVSAATGGGASSSSAGALNVNLVNQSGTPLQASAKTDAAGNVEILLTQLKTAIADDISGGRGAVNMALKRRYGLKETIA